MTSELRKTIRRAGGRHRAAIMLPVLLAGCVSPSAPQRVSTPTPPVRVVQPRVVPPGATPRPPAMLLSELERLGRGFDGVVGIAVRDVQAGWSVSWNGTGRFPQQSVSKLWVALTLLDAVDRGTLRLEDPITVRRSDLTLFHQPVRAMMGPDGFTTSIRNLLTIAMTQSDNTANDVLLQRVGGPSAVRAFFTRASISGIAFGPGEKLLQSRIAGMEWKPEYAGGQGWLVARAALPLEVRRAALERYLADPMDGAQPEGMVAALARLRKGDILSPGSTQVLLSIMAQSKTGPQRLKGGLGENWAFAHKTGTGQELGSLATGYNDVGLLTAPDGRTFAVAVMIASTRQPIWARMQLMQNVTRAVVSFAGARPS
ncbi:class A beta-lactamase [Sphingomonas solaris]|uniref:beta-lactamase n=1 Tax=Alterirhizorhabdus solaris TaxID=2529389 RepID=A0A558RD29_9SPHN|nr:class A beta-lactamase [Sphingomonas solaris]TVV77254.1 class A beta-lactamase [Sphingomonas solaris]